MNESEPRGRGSLSFVLTDSFRVQRSGTSVPSGRKTSGGLDLADGVPDHAHRGDAAWGEGNALRPTVVGTPSTLELAEPFELAEQVVRSLLADS